MLAVISPAKRLDFERGAETSSMTQPALWDESLRLLKHLRGMKAHEVGALMKLSDKLAELNYQRFQTFPLKPSKSLSGRPALLAFDGDTYQGLDASSMTTKSMDYARDHLFILSGLYGLLRSFDEIHPYRLEMGTKLSVGNSIDLYQFWKKKVTDKLVNELERNELLVNLASKEYFSVVDTKVIKSPIVSPEFKDFKNGKLKIISFYAKKARGMMARYLIEKNAKSLDDINSFEISGYRLSNEETINKFNPVFIR